ncbi:hypothetical protein LCGC14_2299530 [marine sediment metagenome]|uniref:AP2/ERF domain-containing protein n=1 Tax=marine sediment metagenome TaxID=412755 RepID=A0A0F9F1A8_9ZZZZ
MVHNTLQLTNHVFGQLTVLERVGSNHRGDALWKCVCACGNRHVAKGSNLKKGDTTSCGCIRSKNLKRGLSLQHGGASKTKHPLYQVWSSMKNRCYNPNNQAYSGYGGRGITVCSLWKDSFVTFLDDMEKSYCPGLSLDRIDNNQGYSASNCRWATRREQSRNRRKASGLPLGVFVRKGGKYTAQVTLGTFETPEEAVIAYEDAIQKLEK